MYTADWISLRFAFRFTFITNDIVKKEFGLPQVDNFDTLFLAMDDGEEAYISQSIKHTALGLSLIANYTRVS